MCSTILHSIDILAPKLIQYQYKSAVFTVHGIVPLMYVYFLRLRPRKYICTYSPCTVQIPYTVKTMIQLLHVHVYMYTYIVYTCTYICTYDCTYIVLTDDTNCLYLKLTPSLQQPPAVHDHHVPIFICSKNDIAGPNCTTGLSHSTVILCIQVN